MLSQRRHKAAAREAPVICSLWTTWKEGGLYEHEKDNFDHDTSFGIHGYYCISRG